MKNLTKKQINLLRHHARCMVRELGLLNDAFFEIGITLAERHLLIELNACKKPITMGEIAERLLLDKSTASRLIARALKKKYMHCTSDKLDKRKKYLALSEHGKTVLKAFEAIAFHQTRNALLTLSPEEIQTVYRGMELYSKGLKTTRLNKEKNG